MSRTIFALCWCLISGCALIRDPGPIAQPPAASVPTVVFVTNGAGDFRTAGQNLAAVAANSGAPMRIESFLWSKGYGRSIADQTDRDNQLIHAHRLAEQVSAHRHANPDQRICLVGHSAGAGVVLNAAECLPPGSVDRIVLLSPSVSAEHDLRPVLRASREGLDSFYSNHDCLVLGIGMRIVGTTDGDHRPAAGKVGFRPVHNPTDAALLTKLRQHRWDPSLRSTGHNGFHFGNIEPGFLSAYVVPILAGDRAGVVTRVDR